MIMMMVSAPGADRAAEMTVEVLGGGCGWTGGWGRGVAWLEGRTAVARLDLKRHEEWAVARLGHWWAIAGRGSCRGVVARARRWGRWAVARRRRGGRGAVAGSGLITIFLR